jgi:hypothetical protein
MEYVYLVLAFIAGAVVMDFMWAWRLGMVQYMLARRLRKNVVNDLYETEAQ